MILIRNALKMMLVSSFLIIVSGCASVPPGATTTNQTVSQGILKLEAQHKSTVRAFASSARASVFQVWDYEILHRIIDDERKRHGTNTLTPSQAAVAAATAADVREKLISQINQHENLLLKQVEQNYRGLISINDVVTGYLASLEDLKSASDTVNQELMSMAGISIEELPGPIRQILSIAEDPSSEMLPN